MDETRQFKYTLHVDHVHTFDRKATHDVWHLQFCFDNRKTNLLTFRYWIFFTADNRKWECMGKIYVNRALSARGTGSIRDWILIVSHRCLSPEHVRFVTVVPQVKRVRMNSLAVRLSSIKNGEQVKKNSEIRVSLLDLPPTQEFRKIDDRASDDGQWVTLNWILMDSILILCLNFAEATAFLVKFKEEYLSAKAVEQQLVAVKRVNIDRMRPSIRSL